MPGIEGELPTPQQLMELRERALSKIAEIGSDKFASEDIAKITHFDHYVQRFWLHTFDLPGEQMDEACNMIIESFKWREKFGAGRISFESLPQSAFERGAVFEHNRDKDGKKLLVFAVGKHEKGKVKMEEMKRFFVFYLERLEREEKGQEITLVFDCRNAGIKNMDMEFIQFIIGVFKDYYPNMLNYILVFEMPWVLNAAWKVIKAWLPAAGVKKIKFLNKGNMDEYVDDDNRLECWGGSDPWEYSFDPETFLKSETVPAPHLTNGHAEFEGMDSGRAGDEARKKTVTFAESQGVVRSSSSLDSFSNYSPNVNTGPDILKLNPSQEVVFSVSGSGELMGRVHLTNISEKKIGFKIKTTSPEKYRVRPSSGILKQGQDVGVELHVSGQGPPPSLMRDKFLVTVIYLEEPDVSSSRLQELLKTTKPDAQYRLRCQLASESGTLATPTATALKQSAPATADESTKQLATLLRKINQLTEKTEQLEGQLSTNSKIQILLLVLTLVVLLMVWFYLPSQAAYMCESTSPSEEGTRKSDL